MKNDERIAAKKAQILEWAEHNRATLVMGDRMRLEDVAKFLDRSPSTLRNWLTVGAGPPTAKFKGRTYIMVDGLAGFVVDELAENQQF